MDLDPHHPFTTYPSARAAEDLGEPFKPCPVWNARGRRRGLRVWFITYIEITGFF
jgi:hypothetical protein